MKHLPFAVSLDAGTSRADLTGTWRTERPEYVEPTAPCGNACPAGEDVRSWLYAAESGGAGYEAAWRAIMETNPFPAVCGRVCYHPCETACNRGQLDEAVGINSVERFLGDEGLRQGWTVDRSETTSPASVLVVGAGPAGLSAAYHLVRGGHRVTVVDALDEPGGMMRTAIPRYRLPREVLDAEVARITAMGVRIELGRTVEDLDAEMDAGGYDAAFLAVGASLARRTYLPAGSAAHVVDALTVLHDAASGEPLRLGRRVAVYGGGDTALDAARTARRLGASEALVVYRRTPDRMPAHADELRAASEEGVTFRWLSTITEVDEHGLEVEAMELDDEGYPQPTGRTERLDADSVVLALGQDVDPRLLDAAGLRLDGGVVLTDGVTMMTSRPGVFAGGDATFGERSVTVAIGHGRRAAASIEAWLAHRELPKERTPQLAGFEHLNTWYFEDAPRSHRPRLELVRRQDSFEEVVQGLDASDALFEARRCLSCGGCISCDNCYAVCPDNAVIKLGPPKSYLIDLEYCKGCGLCVEECPVGAVTMVPEEI